MSFLEPRFQGSLNHVSIYCVFTCPYSSHESDEDSSHDDDDVDGDDDDDDDDDDEEEDDDDDNDDGFPGDLLFNFFPIPFEV